jgi:hypothetical protein
MQKKWNNLYYMILDACVHVCEYNGKVRKTCEMFYSDYLWDHERFMTFTFYAVFLY